MSIALVIAIIISTTAGCKEKTAVLEEPSGSQSVPVETVRPEETQKTEAASELEPAAPEVYIPGAINCSFETGFSKTESSYVPVRISPTVADYEVMPDLSNVTNLNQFPNLTVEQKAKLTQNGFVAAPSKEEQLFYIYEDNTYKKIPNFVTTDSVLQVYHVFYDYALRSIESDKLRLDAMMLNVNMLDQLQREYSVITDPVVREQAIKALGYFGVAQLAFGEYLPSGFPEEAKRLVKSEMELLNAGGRQPSALFGYELDYSLFTPRGHYTRSEQLERYFKGMSWYGVVPFPLYKSDGVTRDTNSAIRAIIIATALCRLPESYGGARWENIYSTTSFFVGAADDLTPYQLAGVIKEVYGQMPDLNTVADPDKLDLFYQTVEKLPRAQINAKNALALKEGKNIPTGLQFRFMGQRYIPDSEILQQLTEPNVRPFPTGLDIFATLGSQRAMELIANLYQPTAKWPQYIEAFDSLKAKFSAVPDSLWRSNLYFAWLWTQKSLTCEYGGGYPMFMRNTAWQDKSLATALGSWAEMRHDTILYAKETCAECGGDCEVPVVKAYVEPNPELYNRLLWLTVFMRDNLEARKILPEEIKYACKNFEKLLTFLRSCSVKELTGEELTAEEYDTLLCYGGELEYLTTKCVEKAEKWSQLFSDADRNMAVIADVAAAHPGGYLEEAVGSAVELYVIVPIGEELYLTRGAMFDYYEFVSPTPMTDEEWQKKVKEDPPERPPFTSSFIEGAAAEVPTPLEPYSTGC